MPGAQCALSEMPSSTCATFSQASTLDSSDSKMSRQQIAQQERRALDVAAGLFDEIEHPCVHPPGSKPHGPTLGAARVREPGVHRSFTGTSQWGTGPRRRAEDARGQ